MYHTIVKSIARKNFELVNRKKYDEILKSCDPHIDHRFGGAHALGGRRHDTKALALWFDRLGALAPDLKLTVVDVWVKGFPWSTTIIVRWTATMPGFTFTDDGSPYDNHGVHIIEMSWGNVTRIDANEDSQLVERYLKQRVSEGVVEAGLPPIES